MLPVEPVVNFRMTSLLSLLTKPDAVDDYTSSLCLINEKDVTNAKFL